MIEERKRLIKDLQTAFQLGERKSEEIFEFNAFLGWRKLSEQKEGVHTPSASRDKKYYPVLRWKPSFPTLAGAHPRQTQAEVPWLLPSPPDLLPSWSQCSDPCTMQLFPAHSALLALYPQILSPEVWWEPLDRGSSCSLCCPRLNNHNIPSNCRQYRRVRWDLKADLPWRTLKPGNAPLAQK